MAVKSILTRLRNLLLFLTACFFFTKASAQAYQLQSFDGIPVQVHVFRSVSPRALAITCGRDTVFVYEEWGIEQVKVLNQRFLQLTYAVRGGTNQGLGSTLVVGVAHGKLYQALKIQSYSQADLYGSDYYHKLYRVRLNLLGTNSQTYRFHLTVQDEKRSALDPKDNHRFTRQAVIPFDPERHIFHTGFRKVPAIFPVVDDKMEKVVMLKVSKPLPAIELKGQVQYFIKGKWYEAARTE